MKIAVLADIHSNFAALEAVVADIQRANPDHVIVAGDFANRGPEPEPVMQLLEKLRWPLLRGNHEDYVLGQAGPSKASNLAEAAMWQPARWTAERTRPYHEMMAGLPLHTTLRAPDGSEVWITHGTPRANYEGIYPGTSDADLAAMLLTVNAPLICVAHTHFPLIRRLGGSLVVNVGSVGLPFNGDWRAQYGLMEWQSGEWQVDLRAIEYDRDRTMAAFEANGFLAGGGPMARLIQNEVRDSRPYLGGFVKLFADRVKQGAIGVEDAVRDFLELPKETLHDFWAAIR